MNIGKDFSVRITFGEKEYLVNRCFDHIHIWRELGFSILKIVDPNDGFVQMCLTIPDAEQIAESALIVPIERTEISEREHKLYLAFAELTLSDEDFGLDIDVQSIIDEEGGVE